MGHSGHIDFHCHLDDPNFDDQRWQIIDQCFTAGFSKLVTVADPNHEPSLERTAEMLAYHADIYAVVGAHPHQADRYSSKIEKRMSTFLNHSKILAIGEVGLDFHYNFSSVESQIRVLHRQIAIARDCSLPLVIHSRQAEAQMLKILAEEKFMQPVIFHCYTGDQALADEVVARGYFISFSGIITFKKAEALRKIVAKTPLGNMLCETDSPYLAPEPERGKTNTPMAVIRITEKIAAIKQTTVAAILDQIEKNIKRLKS